MQCMNISESTVAEMGLGIQLICLYISYSGLFFFTPRGKTFLRQDLQHDMGTSYKTKANLKPVHLNVVKR